MKMTKLLLVVAFLVVMAAGAVVGMALDQKFRIAAQVEVHPQSPTTRRGGPMFPKLSQDQLKLMNEFWAPVAKLRDPRRETFQRLDKERDQAIQDLLTPPLQDHLKEQYNAIQARHRQAIDDLETLTREAVTKATEQSRAIMTEEQKKQYDEYLRRFGPRGAAGPGRGGPGRGGPQRGGPRMRPTSGPTTAPAIPLSHAS
ncbi:MAG TPA: hypothetical protein VIM11_27880 [Tepidisphaeraceae bacterium]|jgi:Spy/CpxP family protein refolding chaperone